MLDGRIEWASKRGLSPGVVLVESNLVRVFEVWCGLGLAPRRTSSIRVVVRNDDATLIVYGTIGSIELVKSCEAGGDSAQQLGKVRAAELGLSPRRTA